LTSVQNVFALNMIGNLLADEMQSVHLHFCRAAENDLMC